MMEDIFGNVETAGGLGVFFLLWWGCCGTDEGEGTDELRLSEK